MAITATILTLARLTAITGRRGLRTESLSAPVPGTVGDGDPGAGVVGAAGAGDAVGVGVVEAGATDMASTADAVLPAVALPDADSRDAASRDAASPDMDSPAMVPSEGFTAEAVGSTAEAVVLTVAEAVTDKHSLLRTGSTINGWRKCASHFS